MLAKLYETHSKYAKSEVIVTKQGYLSYALQLANTLPYEISDLKHTRMKGNIIAFLDDIKHERLSTRHICDGVVQFEAAIECQAKDILPSSNDGETSLQLDAPNFHIDAIQPAVNSFVHLVLKTSRKELPPAVFLTTEFNYERSPYEAPESLDKTMIVLIKGLESLMQIYARLPTNKPLQRWAHIAVATNFLHAPPTDTLGRPAAADPSDMENEDATPAEHSPKRQSSGRPSDHQESHVDYKSCSLGMLIEQSYGVREDCHEDQGRPGYKRAFANWEMFLAGFTLDRECDQNFRARLSQPQRSSAHLLIEWWNDEFGLGARTPQAFKALKAASRTGQLENDAFQLFGITPSAIADQRRNHYLQRFLFDCSGPPYHTVMFQLFQLEFLPCHYFGTLAVKTLMNRRQQAARLAACQRVSLRCYKALPGDVAWFSGANMGSAAYDDKKGDLTVNENTMARKTSNLPKPQSEPDHSRDVSENSAQDDPISRPLHLEKRYLHAEETETLKRALFQQSGSRIGASLAPCDWLEDVDVSEDLPHYLWDVENRNTVLAGKLPGIVEYTAVSHTWGRYQYRDYGEFPKVYLDGLKEWSLPQNSKFKVEQLPNILASIPFGTPYVWFDLVCIPQEPTDERLITISKREIGRQAKIFRRARFAVAWFNDVNSWKSMNAAICRLSLNFLQEGYADGFPRSILDLPAINNDSNLELFDDASEMNDMPEDSMNRWFSSLWTLQEVCLRPDMRLCNKEWEVLDAGKNGNLHIGMDDLVALAAGGQFQANAWEDVAEAGTRRLEIAEPSTSNRFVAQSKATDQLWELLDLSGLEHLLNASRTTILTLGNQRYCERNRAEAIMSAVGITDWFGPFQQEAGDRGPPSKSPEYPLVFVREAARKLGAEFYASHLAEGELLEMLVLSLQPAGLPREGVGSMVPFTSSLLSRAPSTAEGFTGSDHPTVWDWKILEDRSVEIRKAAILSYTGQARSGNRDLTCACVAPSPNEPNLLLVKQWLKLDLDAWIDSFLPGTRNYAVCLHCGFGVVDGILLKELSSGELIKVGTYHITKPNAYKLFQPGIYNVNWRVL